MPNPAVMAGLARELGGDVHDRALALALTPGQDQAQAVEALTELGGPALAHAIDLARELGRDSRSDAFAAIIGATSDPPAELLAEAMRAYRDKLHVDASRARLRSLSAQLQPLGKEISYKETAEILSSLTSRRDVLCYIGTMAPSIGWLGGPEALQATKTAVEDVARWWP